MGKGHQEKGRVIILYQMLCSRHDKGRREGRGTTRVDGRVNVVGRWEIGGKVLPITGGLVGHVREEGNSSTFRSSHL